ncbi:MAG: hypothetical protein ACLRQX_10365 [Turicibacter sanguinis]
MISQIAFSYRLINAKIKKTTAAIIAINGLKINKNIPTMMIRGTPKKKNEPRMTFVSDLNF